MADVSVGNNAIGQLHIWGFAQVKMKAGTRRMPARGIQSNCITDPALASQLYLECEITCPAAAGNPLAAEMSNLHFCNSPYMRPTSLVGDCIQDGQPSSLGPVVHLCWKHDPNSH